MPRCKKILKVYIVHGREDIPHPIRDGCLYKQTDSVEVAVVGGRRCLLVIIILKETNGAATLE